MAPLITFGQRVMRSDRIAEPFWLRQNVSQTEARTSREARGGSAEGSNLARTRAKTE